MLGFLQLFGKIFFFTGYFSNSGSYPKPLPPDEEARELEKAAAGDNAAREKLIKHNLRLVAHIAKKYAAGQDMDDLISIGSIGLVKGISTFSAAKGTTLATYLARCIENEILMYLRKVVRCKMEVSLDEPLNVDSEGNELLLGDILGTDNDLVYNDIEVSVEKELLNLSLNKLSKREQQIVNLRFGLNGAEEKTQKEVADLLGISQSYISRLEKKIITRLKKEIIKMV